MHDIAVRVASAFLFSGILLFVAFLCYSALYPRKARAAEPAPAPAVTARAKNYGLLAPVARPLEWTLRGVEARLTHSWGWAILVTTLLINALLLPFRILAARHAQKMKALQPEIDDITARCKEPDRSREIAAVYSAHQTSPVAGCIPALAPFAVLAGFYSVLTGIAQLHGARWLWIADLALPEQLPVRILPVLMIATQLWLARITPASPGMDPKLSRLMSLMPLAFGIALYGQPAALMLYWVTSNLLQLAQNYWPQRNCPSR